MKILKMLTVTAAIAVVGFAVNLAVAEEGAGKPPGGKPGHHGPGPGPMMEHLVPPALVEELNLTADQKAKLDELDSAFKKDAEALREKRKASVDKFRALLTDEQKAKLEAAKEKMHERHGEKGGGKGPKPPHAE